MLDAHTLFAVADSLGVEGFDFTLGELGECEFVGFHFWWVVGMRWVVWLLL